MSTPTDSTSNDPYSAPEASGVSPGAAALLASPVFAGVVITQFLGAFNDNYFKQMLMLKCVEFEKTTKELTGTGVSLQPYALVAFALPFVLLSGMGGYVSDRFSRQRVILFCKIGEIAVMACSLLVLLIADLETETQLMLLIGVLALMGGQSALFGPSKYGILPELFSRKQLLPVNGAVQMTTFLAIIFGMALAGIALDVLDDSLWFASVVAVGIAFLGTLSSLLIRRTNPADPTLPMRLEMLFVPRETWRLIFSMPTLRNSLLMTTLFWFIGGVAQPAVNNLGILVFQMSQTRTSLMAASIGIGIAIGCVVSGTQNKKPGDGTRWVLIGGWLIVLSLVILTVLSSGVFGQPHFSDAQETIWGGIVQADAMEWLMRGGMLFFGFSAGLFVIPIQTYIQEAPPPEQKGRVIGAMNLLSWMGIVVSAAFIGVSDKIADMLASEGSPYGLRFIVFAALAVVMLPGAMFFRLRTDVESSDVK